jgi:streptogramin lyase
VTGPVRVEASGTATLNIPEDVSACDPTDEGFVPKKRIEPVGTFCSTADRPRWRRSTMGTRTEGHGNGRYRPAAAWVTVMTAVVLLATACGGGNGAATHFVLRTKKSEPVGVTTGPDGHAWFTEFTADRIGRVNTDGTVDEFPVPTPRSGPYGIAAGPNGNLWFTEFAGNKISRIGADGHISEFPIPYQAPPPSQPFGVAAGADGNIWFSEEGTGKIGRITPSGVVSGFGVGSGYRQLEGLAAGPDGAVWFADTHANSIARHLLGRGTAAAK